MKYVIGYIGYEEGPVVRLQGLDKNGQLSDVIIEDTELAVNGRLTYDDMGRVIYEDADPNKDNKPARTNKTPKEDKEES